MMPLPPRRFSTIAGCPFSLSLCATMRAARSPRPPAGTPTTMPIMLLLRVLVRGLGKSFIKGLQRRAVGMAHDIDEPPRARLPLGQRVIALPQRMGARDQLGQIEQTNLRHFGHRLALSRREPVRAAKLQASGHEADR